MRMHHDVHRSSRSIMALTGRRWGRLPLVILILCWFGVPAAVGARASDDAAPHAVHTLVESSTPATLPESIAPIDPPGPRAPEPPVQRADTPLVVEITAPNARLFVRGASLASKQTSAITSTVRVSAGNVRINPDIDSAIVGKVHQGDVVTILGISEGWYLVQLTDRVAAGSSIEGEVAWVSDIVIDIPSGAPTLAASPATAYRWLAASDQRTIFDNNGTLHLRVTDEQASTAVSSTVNGRGDLAPAKEISFTLTLHWAKGHAPGGSIFHTMLGDGRDLQMHVGPGEGYPWVEFALDDELIEGSGTGFPLYTPTAVQFVWDGTEVVASVGGEERARVATTTPMTALRIAIETDPGCVFHLTVDDMTVVSN